MSYIEQLKTTYNNAAEAYRAYILSKGYNKLTVISEDAPEEIKKSYNLIEGLNQFSQELIHNDRADIKKYWNIIDIPNFFKENQEKI